MKNNWLSIIIIALLILVLGVQFFTASAPYGRAPVHPDRIRQLAAELEAEELYTQAIDKYQQYLDSAHLPEEVRTNILYRMGNIYLEELHDYENALAAFIQISDLYPQTKIAAEADKKKMPCYEGLKRGYDAQKKLEQLTDLHPKEEGTGPVVAKIGERTIHLDQIEREIAQMPKSMQQQFQTPQKKLDYVRNKIFQELLYDMALRKEYNTNPEIREQILEFEKNLLAGKVYQEEVRGKVEITPNDLKLYYKAHKEDFVTPASAKIAHIQAGTQEQIDRISNELQNGLAFEKAVEQYSQNEKTKTANGALGAIHAKQNYIPGLGQSPAAVNQILSLNENQISEPLQINQNYHIFKVLSKTPQQQQPFEQVKQRVQQMVRQMKEQEKREQLLDHLLASEKVKIYEQSIYAHSVQTPKEK